MPSKPAPLDPLAFPVLVGDIGGTNARFAIQRERDAPLDVFPFVATADFPDLETAVETSVFPRTDMRPKSAIIDLAGPVSGDEVPLTNALWRLKPREIMARTSIADVILLNDFEALAMALTSLDDDALTLLGGDAANAAGAKVVLGPGTGLGVGALVEAGHLFVPVPGEGGHVALGPETPDEFDIWRHIEPEHGRISAEALLCGRGLVRLYRAVARADGVEPAYASPAQVTDAALAGGDPAAVRTVSLYGRLLGRVAGDMALVFMARGGVYVGGGIPPRILPFLTSGEFRRAFESKAPHAAAMGAIPSWVITRDSPALAGLAAFASHPDRFGVSLTGRRWRS